MDITAATTVERDRLVAVLDGLDAAAWATPSACAGWTVRDVAVHVLMAYELSLARFLVLMVAARFDFDRLAHQWAVRDRRAGPELAATLGSTVAVAHFNVPGAPTEAPLTHLVLHAEDVLRPLGVTHAVDPESADVVLSQLVGGREKGLLGTGALDGLALSSTDSAWRHGSGAPVHAPASALLSTLSGRVVALDELDGEGADLLRDRVRERRGPVG